MVRGEGRWSGVCQRENSARGREVRTVALANGPTYVRPQCALYRDEPKGVPREMSLSYSGSEGSGFCLAHFVGRNGGCCSALAAFAWDIEHRGLGLGEETPNPAIKP